jgi:hypothetical protein
VGGGGGGGGEGNLGGERVGLGHRFAAADNTTTRHQTPPAPAPKPGLGWRGGREERRGRPMHSRRAGGLTSAYIGLRRLGHE